MPLLLLKLTLTPLIVGGASLAARHWGASVGGWIVALPLTSPPVRPRGPPPGRGPRVHASSTTGMGGRVPTAPAAPDAEAGCSP